MRKNDNFLYTSNVTTFQYFQAVLYGRRVKSGITSFHESKELKEFLEMEFQMR